jgi:DNA helicase-2/ATP-dependent DNA helicase PcrA
VLDVGNSVRPHERGHRLVLRADRIEGNAKPTLIRCYDGDAQARAVAEAILAAHEEGQPLREQAVLMRAGSHSRELETELGSARFRL